MTPDPNTLNLEAALGRAFSIAMSARSRAFVGDRVSSALAGERERRIKPPRFGFRRPVVLAVGLLVGSGLLAAVGAATNIIRLEWGSLPDQQRTPAQINAEIAAAMKTTPVPPGYSFPALSVPEDSSVWGSYSGQSMVEFNAICAWYGDWTVAFANGEHARLARDRAMLDEILTWKTITDPALADDSVRNLFVGLNASADAGQLKPIDEFRANNCSAP
jgi:hypothetical protein